MKPLILAGLLLTAGALTSEGQVGGVRFEITRVGDSTISFPRGRAGWVRRGQVGIAVDPKRRDALVAQFRVVAIESGIATAVVTGATTRPLTEHIAILYQPARSWFRTPLFWGSLAVGFALGVMTGALF